MMKGGENNSHAIAAVFVSLQQIKTVLDYTDYGSLWKQSKPLTEDPICWFALSNALPPPCHFLFLGIQRSCPETFFFFLFTTTKGSIQTSSLWISSAGICIKAYWLFCVVCLCFLFWGLLLSFLVWGLFWIFFFFFYSKLINSVGSMQPNAPFSSCSLSPKYS